MNELNIAKMLLDKRREKGITQKELAGYLGVSEASVSKWEMGKSYPEITLLPQLADYFHISVDELIGYQPQGVKEEAPPVNDDRHQPWIQRMIFRRMGHPFCLHALQRIFQGDPGHYAD